MRFQPINPFPRALLPLPVRLPVCRAKREALQAVQPERRAAVTTVAALPERRAAVTTVTTVAALPERRAAVTTVTVTQHSLGNVLGYSSPQTQLAG